MKLDKFIGMMTGHFDSNKISICQSGNIQNISISCYALPYFNRFMIEIRTFTDKLSDITTFDMITL